ncbi:HEPN domain-containing protein [Nostoc sp.]|uniref:ApeA N-terminal domain 1-containing protein n=1 Tax=Nostoc sp. TaxID=1180 RepID=UPI002FF7205C
MEEFISSGKWWLPSQPQITVPGKLSFSPKSGAKLELIGSFYNSEFQEIAQAADFITPDVEDSFWDSTIREKGVAVDFIKPEEKIILGLLENNEEITLYSCFGQVKNFDLIKGRSIFIFQVTYVFRKIHFQDEDSIKLKSIYIQYSNFREWVRKSGIKVILPQGENQLYIIYQPPRNIYLTTINELNISITFSQIYINPFDLAFGATYYKANIEQTTYLTIDNPHNKSLNECIDLLIHFRDLLSFAISIPSSITSVTGKVDIIVPNPIAQDDGTYIMSEKVQELEIIILFDLWDNVSHSETQLSLYEMLFVFSDVEDRLGDIFREWINKQEEYKPVFQLLMTTMYTPNLYLNYGFLNVMQALEVYHSANRAKYKGIYHKDKIYKNGIFKKLLEVIEEFPGESVDQTFGISDDFREVLKGKLNFLNQVTLQTRLNEIIEDISCLLPSDFIGNVQDRQLFVSRASNTRHAWTHHDEKQRKKAAKGKELIQLFHTLTVILQVCLLRELNFTDETIKNLISRNRKHNKEWHPLHN